MNMNHGGFSKPFNVTLPYRPLFLKMRQEQKDRRMRKQFYLDTATPRL